MQMDEWNVKGQYSICIWPQSFGNHESCHKQNHIFSFKKKKKKNNMGPSVFLAIRSHWCHVFYHCFTIFGTRNVLPSLSLLNWNTFSQLQKPGPQRRKPTTTNSQDLGNLRERYSHPLSKWQAYLKRSSRDWFSAGHDFLPHASPVSVCFGGYVLCSSAALKQWTLIRKATREISDFFGAFSTLSVAFITTKVIGDLAKADVYCIDGSNYLRW